MASSKRPYASIERELVRTLTRACETAKYEIDGFVWLTHEVDYQQFPQSLRVIWMFDSEASLQLAASGPGRARMLELTQAAFDEIGISVSQIAAHVSWRREPAASRRDASRGQGH